MKDMILILLGLYLLSKYTSQSQSQLPVSVQLPPYFGGLPTVANPAPGSSLCWNPVTGQVQGVMGSCPAGWNTEFSF
jgi:hypothetical protein